MLENKDENEEKTESEDDNYETTHLISESRQSNRRGRQLIHDPMDEMSLSSHPSMALGLSTI